MEVEEARHTVCGDELCRRICRYDVTEYWTRAHCNDSSYWVRVICCQAGLPMVCKIVKTVLAWPRLGAADMPKRSHHSIRD